MNLYDDSFVIRITGRYPRERRYGPPKYREKIRFIPEREREREREREMGRKRQRERERMNVSEREEMEKRIHSKYLS